MNLPVPNVGQEPGPDWADDINNCMALIDAHDHTNGSGVKITPSGLNINSNLTFQGNSPTSVGSVDFLVLSVTTAVLNSIYDVSGDLYFNDGAGNVIRITQSGSVVGPAGSITGLVPPASATYVAGSQTFVWQAGANLPATMDAGSIIIRNLVVSSFGITLQAPPLAFDYSLTLPALPPVQSFMTLDAAGNMAAPWTVDNNTIVIVGNQLTVNGGNVTLGEHAWELNGRYPTLTYPQFNVDSVFFAPYNLTILSVWIYNGNAGTAGTTFYDLAVASPGGAFASILSTTGAIDFSAAGGIWTDSGAVVGPQAGVTKPVLLTTAITAGQAIVFNLLGAMTGTATDARIRITYKRS